MCSSPCSHGRVIQRPRSQKINIPLGGNFMQQALIEHPLCAVRDHVKETSDVRRYRTVSSRQGRQWPPGSSAALEGFQAGGGASLAVLLLF